MDPVSGAAGRPISDSADAEWLPELCFLESLILLIGRSGAELELSGLQVEYLHQLQAAAAYGTVCY